MLYILGTPIGNLDDISARALQILQGADIVIVESFADSKKLLNAYSIKPKTIEVYNDSNKKKSTVGLLKKIKEVECAVYITSAGTPGVSDPGADLVHECKNAGIDVVPVPGPSALATIMSISGIRSRHTLFVGFLPKRKGKVSGIFEKLDKDTVIVFYESKYRLLKSFELVHSTQAGARVIIGREMTKKFESYLDMSIEEAIDYFTRNNDELRGEFTLLVYLP